MVVSIIKKEAPYTKEHIGTVVGHLQPVAQCLRSPASLSQRGIAFRQSLIGFSQCAVDSDGKLKSIGSPFVKLSPLVQASETIPSPFAVGVLFNHLLQIVDTLVPLTVLFKRTRKVEKRPAFVGIHGYRLTIVVYGLVALTEFIILIADVAINHIQFIPVGGSTQIALDGLLRLVHHAVYSTLGIAHIGVFGLGLLQLLQHLHRLGITAFYAQ